MLFQNIASFNRNAGVCCINLFFMSLCSMLRPGIRYLINISSRFNTYPLDSFIAAWILSCFSYISDIQDGNITNKVNSKPQLINCRAGFNFFLKDMFAKYLLLFFLFTPIVHYFPFFGRWSWGVNLSLCGDKIWPIQWGSIWVIF